MQLFSVSNRFKLVAFVAALECLLPFAIVAQQPVIVQPGAPGQASKVLPASTRAKLPPSSSKDVEFMQGMIHHHAQAVEMVALIESRTQNKELRLLGARISQSQSDEMNFMTRWLEARGQSVGMAMHGEAGPPKGGTPNASMHAHGHEPPKGGTPNAPTHAHGHEPPKGGTSNAPTHAHGKEPPKGGTPNAPTHAHGKEPPKGGTPNAHHILMPGMLTPEQMDALRKAKGAEFDKLFLTGMIQHHNGALIMVADLFNSAGAGQDAELFNFATDVDSGQRAEIKVMRNMLSEKPVEE